VHEPGEPGQDAGAGVREHAMAGVDDAGPGEAAAGEHVTTVPVTLPASSPALAGAAKAA
jgi:hypothetical protein